MPAVDNRADVDYLYAQRVAIGAESLASPAEDDDTLRDYAVSVRDPDGLVRECVYEPQQRGIVESRRSRLLLRYAA